MQEHADINRDRILPLVGEHFKTKTFGLLNIGAGFDVADALLRTGVKSLVVFSSTSTEGELYSLAQHAQHLGLKEKIAFADKCDLLIGVGDTTDLLRFRSMIRVMYTEGLFLLLFGSSYALVYLTNVQSSIGNLHEGELFLKPSDTLHMEGVGLLLRAIKAWTLRRTDLEDPAFDSLWEHQLWVKPPYTTRPVRSVLSHFLPDENFSTTSSASSEDRPQTEDTSPHSAMILPPSLERVLEAKVIWVVGVGTGSLVANILRRYPLRSLVLWDGKPFSTFNVVRQDVYPSEVEGLVKSEALINRYAAQTIDRYAEQTNRKIRPTRVRHLHAVPFAIDTSALTEALSDPDTIPRPNLVILATGETKMLNHDLCVVLRQHRIPYIVPSALPSAAYLKFIVSFSNGDVCYSCLQGKQTIDVEQPTMNTQARELFYGGTQPATLFETYPSAYRLMELVYQMLVRPVFRSAFFRTSLKEDKNCFLQANVVEKTSNGFLYGLGTVGEIKAFGVSDLRSWKGCEMCGRTNGEGSVTPCIHCKTEPQRYGEFCSSKHAMMYALEVERVRRQTITHHATLLGEPGLD